MSHTNKSSVPFPLDKSFWDEQWRTGRTFWDTGQPSPAITEYMAQYANKNAAILIPGCGSAYEAEWLADNGFTDITLLDIAPNAVLKLKEKFKDKPQITVLNGDFFEHYGEYDLVIEQTFFCANPLERRKEYARKVHAVLKDGGRLMGLLFGREFDRQGPPFGGSSEIYKAVFDDLFTVKTMALCYNSISPRAGSELFINFQKKEK